MICRDRNRYEGDIEIDKSIAVGMRVGTDEMQILV